MTVNFNSSMKLWNMILDRYKYCYNYNGLSAEESIQNNQVYDTFKGLGYQGGVPQPLNRIGYSHVSSYLDLDKVDIILYIYNQKITIDSSVQKLYQLTSPITQFRSSVVLDSCLTEFDITELNSLIESGEWIIPRIRTYDNTTIPRVPNFTTSTNRFCFNSIYTAQNYPTPAFQSNTATINPGIHYEVFYLDFEEVRFNPYFNYLLQPKYNQYIKVFTYLPKTTTDSITPDRIVNKYFVLVNKNFYIDFLNEISIPFTFNEEYAINSPVKDFNDGYKPSKGKGQGTSTIGGGNGTQDNTSDPIDFPEPPEGILGTEGTNSLSVYELFNNELRNFNDWLYSNDLKTIVSKWFNDPMDAILSVKRVPYKPISDRSSSTTIRILGNDTGVICGAVTEQFQIIDCGEINVQEFWGNTLDYSPYTKIELYLPFIGIKTFTIDEIMNSTLHIKYYIDIITGSGQCMVKVTKEDIEAVLYLFDCNIACEVPISAKDYVGLVQTGIAAVGKTVASIATGNAFGAAEAVNSVMNVVTSKPQFQKTGNLSTVSGVLAPLKPYVIVTRPYQSLPENYNTFKGYPSNITSKLGDLKGYTEVEYVHLEGFNTATDAERTMIENQLKAGIIL